jgi:hypothetical protein
METRPSSTGLQRKQTFSILSRREYYRTKRNNSFASIQKFRHHWNCYHMLDQIWMREFADLQAATNSGRMFPLLLYFMRMPKCA